MGQLKDSLEELAGKSDKIKLHQENKVSILKENNSEFRIQEEEKLLQQKKATGK